MLPPSVKLPVWASDELVTSGPETGETTKLVPTSGELAQGYRADQTPPARKWNYLMNLGGTQWDEYLRQVLAQQMRVERIITTQKADGPVAYFAGLYVIGNKNATTRVVTSPDLNQWVATDPGAIEPFIFADFAQSSTKLIACQDNSDAIISTTDGLAWVYEAGVLPGTFTAAVSIAWHAANSRWVAIDNGSGRAAHNNNSLGTNWTDDGVVAAGGGTYLVSNGVELLAATGAKIIRSTDGINWTDVVTGLTSSLEPCWLEDEWVVIVLDGDDMYRYSSPTGASGTWTIEGPVTLVDTFDSTAASRSIMYALLGSDSKTVLVSLDHGRTWYSVLTAQGTFGSNQRLMRVANGRLITPTFISGTNTELIIGPQFPPVDPVLEF